MRDLQQKVYRAMRDQMAYMHMLIAYLAGDLSRADLLGITEKDNATVMRDIHQSRKLALDTRSAFRLAQPPLNSDLGNVPGSCPATCGACNKNHSEDTPNRDNTRDVRNPLESGNVVERDGLDKPNE